jgi:hypothetical protein
LKESTGALPGRVRLASLLALVLAGVCGLLSAWEGFSLSRFSELRQARPAFRLAPDPALAEQLRASQMLALEQMREPRMVVLFALSLACSLTFVASTRLLRPAGLPREGVRRILVWALVSAAALRTIDGAQATVVAQRAAEVLRRELPLPPGIEGATAERLRGMLAPAALVGTLLQTVLVAGTLIVLSQYFRSPGVRQWVEQADTQAR